jgi:hypothetical protein
MERLEWLAWFTDSAVRIPGTRRTVGADGLFSIVPGVGSLVGTGMSLYVFGEALRHGAPMGILTRMGLNIAADTLLGAIPFVADPLLIEWASWLASAGTGVGEWLVVAVWALVSMVLLAVGFIATRLVPRLGGPGSVRG